eukprot:1115258-Prymnesium_polylepis.1
MSETGVVQVDDAEVVGKGRLGPGNMITLDLQTGDFRQNVDVKLSLASQAPYGEWLAAHRWACRARAPAPALSERARSNSCAALQPLARNLSRW